MGVIMGAILLDFLFPAFFGAVKTLRRIRVRSADVSTNRHDTQLAYDYVRNEAEPKQRSIFNEFMRNPQELSLIHI